MKPLSAAPPRQRARSATAERESYQAIFLDENRRAPMISPPPAPPRQRARSATAERESYQAIFLDDSPYLCVTYLCMTYLCMTCLCKW